MHYMGKSNYLKKLLQKSYVIDISFNNEHTSAFKKSLASSFQCRVIVIVEVVESEDAVATAFEGGGHMGSDESGGAGDQDREPVSGSDFGGGSDPFFPSRAAP